MPVKLNSSAGGSVTLDVPSTASNFTATLPANTGNVVLDGATQTLTNKTLTSPTITGAVMSSMASSVLTPGTAQTNTLVLSIDFTGIPSWARRITVMFNGVSTNGSSAFLIQLGAGSVATSGYQSNGMIFQGGSTPTSASSTSGFISSNAGAAADFFHGSYTYNLLGGNFWTGGGSLVRYSGTYQTHMSVGGVTLGGTLDRVRITTVNGTDLFDAGTINVMWE
jgi:hypothetical protein